MIGSISSWFPPSSSSISGEFIFYVRLVWSEFFVVDDITASDMRVKARPATICIVVLALELMKGLHSVSGIEARADHYRYMMYETTIDEVSRLASSLVLNITIT